MAASSGTRIDLSGVTIESGDSVPARYVGIGVASRGVDGVTVLGGVIRGYRYGVRLEGGRNHRLSGIDVSASRRQLLRSTAEHFDSLDRLDVGRLDASDLYGAGLMLRGTTGASVTSIIAHGGQNGIGLVDASESYVADNDLADNSGWAIHLFRSSRNTILRNDASRTRRCPGFDTDCSAAAILLREGSDSNTIAENDLTASDDRRAGDRPAAAHAAVDRQSGLPERRVARDGRRLRGAGHLERELPREPGGQRRRGLRAACGSRAGSSAATRSSGLDERGSTSPAAATRDSRPT